MAPLPYKAIVSSDFFRFIVGDEKEEFSLHRAPVAAQSKSLDKLVNGHMKEAADGCVDWTHVDQQTFFRFSEFLYTGDYQEPKVQVQVSPTEDCASEPTLSFRSGSRAGSPKINFSELVKLPPSPWSIFKQLHPDPAPKSSQYVLEEATDDAEVLFCHVDMYVFADYWLIEELQSLALRKLHRALVRFDLRDDNVGDIIQLVGRCYNQTGGRTETDRLRRLVNQYTASRVKTLWENQEFCELAASSSDFVKGLISEIVRQL